jgi:AraC-like DNA-binding protein
MARARELLQLSSRTLKEMAWELGYDDPNAFARAFRRTVGMSPAAYRRRFGHTDKSSAWGRYPATVGPTLVHPL